MEWTKLIKALSDEGMTQPQIAAACGCGQSTISDLSSGKTTDPRMSTGTALLKLARARGIAFDAAELASVVAPEEVRTGEIVRDLRSGEERRKGPPERRQETRRAGDRADDIAAAAANPGA